MRGLSTNDLALFAGQMVVTLGALQLRFQNLPRNTERARDFVIQFAAAMVAWRVGVPSGLVMAAFEVVAWVYDQIVEVFLAFQRVHEQLPFW